MHLFGEEMHLFGEEMNLFGEEMNLFGEEMHLFGEKMHLFGEKMHLFGEEMHLFGEEMNLFGEEMNLFGEEMNLFGEKMHLFDEKMNLFGEEMNLFDEEMNLFDEKMNLFGEKMNLFGEEMHLFNKKMHLLFGKSSVACGGVNRSPGNAPGPSPGGPGGGNLFFAIFVSVQPVGLFCLFNFKIREMMKEYRPYTLYNFRTIPQIAALPKGIADEVETVGQVLPFKTNNYVVEELIDWGRVESDPLFTLNFPRRGMLESRHYSAVERLRAQEAPQRQVAAAVREIRLSLNPNPAGQEHNVPSLGEIRLRGIQHKYPETVLFFPSQGQTCHAYCTFCFRWPQFSGMSGLKFAMKESDLLLRYLRVHREVTDVLFTGGDPMVMPAERLSAYILPLLSPEAAHVRSVRIGTKSLAYWPYRYLSDGDSDEVLRLFERVVQAGKNLSIQAHFNHPRELSTVSVQRAIARIRGTGAQIRTQSPVMRHINDDPALWSEMWRKQVDLNCIPYYMFVARDTGARHYFELPLERCWNIFRRAYRKVSGLCRTVRGPSMSGHPGKIQLLGVQEVKGERIFVLRFLQARNPAWVDIPFFAAYDPKATWLSQLRPAFGEEEFFFEKNRKPSGTKPFLFE